MANLTTRISLRNDVLSNWTTSDVQLNKGEVALARLSGELSDKFEMRIGVGGKTWNELSDGGIMIPAMMFALSAAISIVAFAIRKPKLIISDYSVMINTPVPWEVCFEEVDSFYPTSYKGEEMICIRYKKDVEAGVTIEEVEDGISLRKKTLLNPGEPYDIYVTGLAKKPKDILNLLNERLKA